MPLVSLWMAVIDGQDGSAYVRFFNTKKEAEEYIADDDQQFNDNIKPIVLDLDDNLKLKKVPY